MALAFAKANFLEYPNLPYISKSPSYTSILMDAAGEKVAFIGPVYTPNGGAKNIQTVGFRSGSVTFNVASVLTVSLQNRSTTSVPFRPDESVDQSYTLTGAAVTANSWLSGTLDTTRAVNFGDIVCVVFEITTFNASDVVNITGHAPADGNRWHILGAALKSGAGPTWGIATVLPNIVFGFDDSTFGGYIGGAPSSAVGAITAYQSGSTPDEQALRIVPPFNCKVYGCWMEINMVASAAATADAVLYDSGGSVLSGATYSITDDDISDLGSSRLAVMPFTDMPELTAGSVYFLALKPTSAQTMAFFYSDVAAQGHLQALSGGDECYLCTRTDAAAWPGTETKTRRPRFGLLISHLDDGAGGGSGGGLKLAGRGGLAG